MDTTELGCETEMAFAKMVDRYYEPSVGKYKAPDVGGVQVRGTRFTRGHLIWRPGDPEEEPFVLIIAELPYYRLAGWCYGHEVNELGWYGSLAKRQPPAWNVPQERLRQGDWPWG